MHGGLGTEAAQLAASGVTSGALLGLLGMSFALILSVTQRFHVAYIATLVAGVYGYVGMTRDAHLPSALAIVVGLIVAGLLGVALEWGVYRYVSRGAARIGADPLIPIFVASLGIVVAVENIITLIWGSAGLPVSFMPLRSVIFGPIHLTSLDFVNLGASVLLIGGTTVLMKYSRTGRFVAGVRDNPVMATIVGVRGGMVVSLVFFVGSMMAAVIGLLQAGGAAAQPTMGFNSMLTAFVVAFAAGTTAPPIRYLIFGVLVGEIESLATLWLNSSWQDAVLFGIVIVLVSSREIRPRQRYHVWRLRHTDFVGDSEPALVGHSQEETSRQRA